eukprot:CAMPEP_0201567954 /NCGR_PEP_ID=MMETSP0190_2-20130828/8742_1 /ASSEMBLY_ACC=CAM_ASM_000263 /TAXON_ID=37353 /ORGANISM="Rosalina sp." /LENGTH=46 /DNA_ID= /DNA_START= /DNA_END= /DNA_ORIENTATION=
MSIVKKVLHLILIGILYQTTNAQTICNDTNCSPSDVTGSYTCTENV